MNPSLCYDNGVGSDYLLGETLGDIGKRRAWRPLGPGDIDGPEGIMPDRGCEVSRSCLDCPLPRCKHDDPIWYMRQVRDTFDPGIVATYESFGGLTCEERILLTMRRMNLTRALVSRALRRSGIPLPQGTRSKEEEASVSKAGAS